VFGYNGFDQLSNSRGNSNPVTASTYRTISYRFAANQVVSARLIDYRATPGVKINGRRDNNHDARRKLATANFAIVHSFRRSIAFTWTSGLCLVQTVDTGE